MGDFFESLSDSLWTYVVLGLSAIVTEEISPIFGGIAANQGDLRLPRVILALTLGGWGATSLLYVVGRLKWDWIRRRWPRVRSTGTVALRVVGRNPLTASFFVRFAFGLRVVLPMVCGAARVPLLVYLPATLAGSLLWSVVFALVGYAAGEAAVQLMGRVGRTGELVGALVLATALLLFVRWFRLRKERKMKKHLEAEQRVAARERETR